MARVALVTGGTRGIGVLPPDALCLPLGMGSLPFQIPVQVEMIVEID